MNASRWTAQTAWDWYAAQPWLCGFNYVPSTAINTTAFWQAETFDAVTIQRELGWAAALGFNTCRVFLQYLVWEHDAAGLRDRLAQFLAAAAARGISVMPVLFDDCAFAGKQPYLGPQDAPVPGIHNSGWTPSPGFDRVRDRSCWPRLEPYIHDLVGRFAHDPRILAWDLYNEPGNSGLENDSLPLLEAAFGWARAVQPNQPLTAGVWNDGLAELNAASLALSDIITFHSYGTLPVLEEVVNRLESTGYPLLCTEWMARTLGSTWETHLPFFKARRIGCYSWGLVSGKTQTMYPWGSPEGTPEPERWFHDLFYPDGRPYRESEVRFIRAALAE